MKDTIQSYVAHITLPNSSASSSRSQETNNFFKLSNPRLYFYFFNILFREISFILSFDYLPPILICDDVIYNNLFI